MTRSSTTPTDAADRAAALLEREIPPERVLRPRSPGYDAARRVWNRDVATRPALIVRCRHADEVAAAVVAARETGLALSVRGGGHDWAGRALREGGLVVDLTGMRDVAIDPAAPDVAEVAGGATTGDVVAAAGAHDRTAAVGTVGAVGMAGFTLGGGYGPLVGRAGLAADNLLAAEVVLADGRRVHTDDDPDLRWALRGGGGNLGVVTAMTVRLHAPATLTAGMVLFDWAQAADVMAGYAELAADAPDDLTVQLGVMTGPDGAPCVFVAPFWSGDPGASPEVVERVTALGTPVSTQVGPATHAEVMALFGSFVPDGLAWDIRTRTVATLGPGTARALQAAGESLPSPQAMVSTHHFHGAATRAGDGACFGLRRDHLVVEILAGRPPGAADAPWAWADAVADDLAADALPGGYPNLLGPDRDEQIADAYGPHAERLLAVKRRLDPDGALTATPLPRAS